VKRRSTVVLMGAVDQVAVVGLARHHLQAALAADALLAADGQH
jgi:hypothetical protein